MPQLSQLRWLQQIFTIFRQNNNEKQKQIVSPRLKSFKHLNILQQMGHFKINQAV